jgi:hypothetical protein
VISLSKFGNYGTAASHAEKDTDRCPPTERLSLRAYSNLVKVVIRKRDVDSDESLLVRRAQQQAAYADLSQSPCILKWSNCFIMLLEHLKYSTTLIQGLRILFM